jgi:hypothetical protein
MGLQNVVLFGHNIESYNWSLLTVLAVLEVLWVTNKLVPAAVQVGFLLGCAHRAGCTS